MMPLVKQYACAYLTPHQNISTSTNDEKTAVNDVDKHIRVARRPIGDVWNPVLDVYTVTTQTADEVRRGVVISNK